MSVSLRKKNTFNLSTWGHRGTAGLVEEWESRVPLPEEKRQSRRLSPTPTPPSTESSREAEEQNSQ